MKSLNIRGFISFVSLGILLYLPIITSAGELPKAIEGKDGVEMVLIPGGEFTMGSDEDDLKDMAPHHTIRIDDFYIDKYEVSNRQFAAFLSNVKPSEGEKGLRWNWIVLRSDLSEKKRENMWPTEIVYEKNRYRAFDGFENYPALTVTWDAADAYCEWAGKRLPTEAEWEKAARGGLEKKVYPWGNEIPTSGVNFDKRWRLNTEPSPTVPVGYYLANGYGLYNIVGNVWEWCSDWYDPNYYKKSPDRNPKGPETGFQKVLRGGSWFNDAMGIRVAVRNWASPVTTNEDVGFRCAMDAGKASE
jgi:formylglycine-generating enzyme required for sulfatase activity